MLELSATTGTFVAMPPEGRPVAGDSLVSHDKTIGMKEYRPSAVVTGGGRTANSPSRLPERTQAREDAPNVLFLVLDVTGFGRLGADGTPMATLNIDRLAARSRL